MFEFILKYWILIVAALTMYGGLLKLCWDVRSMKRSRTKCEQRCTEKVDALQSEYNDDLKEMRADLKEISKLSASMNLSLTALTSFLQGKGVTP